MPEECFISLDVETAGPNPADYSLLSLGAVLVSDPQQQFYVEFKPVNRNNTAEAQSIHGLSLDALAETGLEPRTGLQRLVDWLAAVCGDRQPVFVAFNAPFDWMFVADYLHHYLGHNPFGHRAIDIKAAFLGLHGGPWVGVSFQHVSQHYGLPELLNHNALDDAYQTAIMFSRILKDIEERRHA